MRLHRLVLTNYRGISHREIAFAERGVTVVCGANEIGKSSMIEALDMLLARNTPVVPALQFEQASVVRGREFKLPQAVIDGHQETLEGGAESARMILRAGGRIGLGGDYGFAWNPHGDYAKEISFFVNYVGFTPLEAIRSATLIGAEIMGRGEEFGTVEPGKLADLLIVDGDPIAEIRVLEDRSHIIAVMQGGVVKAGRLAARRDADSTGSTASTNGAKTQISVSH